MSVRSKQEQGGNGSNRGRLPLKKREPAEKTFCHEKWEERLNQRERGKEGGSFHLKHGVWALHYLGGAAAGGKRTRVRE